MTLPHLALALALLAGTAAADEPRSAAPAARLAVEPESFDFGRVRPDATVEKEFRLRNFGGAELVIERITTTCGCTVVQEYKKHVPPGESTTLRVKLQTRSQAGRLVRSVLIRSNDASGATREIKLEATVVEAER